MIMVGLAGPELAREEQRQLERFPIGNFVLFERNLAAPGQIVRLCRELWRLAAAPPLLAVDQEGGRVARLPPPFTRFPSMAEVGRVADERLAHEVGRAIARELAAAGINTDFAPVLDVLTDPENRVIGDRSLGGDPRRVAALGTAILRGLRAGGVIPCGKHFPGHGGTSVDSHVELPVVTRSVEELQAVELVPFRSACAEKVESLMTAHVLYPALDAERPATLSAALVQTLLRESWRYEGAVITDDLEMGAIANRYSLEESVCRAVEAGVDLLLFCHRWKSALRAFEILIGLAERGGALRERIERSQARIARLKRRRLRAFSGDERALERLFGRHRRLVERITAACKRCTR
jgi:beta-N-acetylhexosaminidase